MAGALDAALALHREGRLDDAARAYEELLAGAPSDALAWHYFSLLRAQQGRFGEALQLAANAAAADPGFASAHCTYGSLLVALGRNEEAIAHLQRALAIDPQLAQAHNNLGSALWSLERFDEACAAYERAVAAQPAYAQALGNLATAQRLARRPKEALEAADRALALAPGNASAHFTRGYALGALGRPQDALAALDAAVRLDPDSPPAIAERSVVLTELGRIDDAAAELERGLALAPDNPAMLRTLIRLRPQAFTPQRRERMEALARNERLPVEGRIELHYALGQALEAAGEFERSFEHLLAGASLQRRLVRYEEAETLAAFERIARVFDAALLNRLQGCGNPSPLPVFIVGMPRSGTTLVEQILASHPLVFGAGELTDFGDIAAETFPAQATEITPERLRAVGDRYIERISALAPTAQRITDKMPANFRYAGLIALALPNARIVHTRRDPVDTCLSAFSLLFGADQPHTYDLAELGRYYRGYARLMEHWRAVLPPGTMLEVSYEAMVGDLEGHARRLLAHCGLAWDDACLQFYKTKRPVGTASAAQVRQPIYRTSVGRAARYGDLLRPLREALEQ